MIILFGLALVLQYYKDIGSRIIDSVFLQIFPGQSGQATKVVRDIGWFPASYRLKPRDDNQLSIAFRISRLENTPIEFGLNITQHPSPFSILCDPDDPLWKDSLRIEINGSSLGMLNPTDFLFYTCIHGIEWKSPVDLRWIVDAHKILTQEKTNINWSRLLEQTQEKRVVLPIINTFAFLLETFNFPIPNFVIHSLETINKQSFYQNEYSAIIAPKSIINNFRKKWFQYARSMRMRNKTAIPNFFGFLEFIKSDWQLINVWSIPFEFLKRGRRFLSK